MAVVAAEELTLPKTLSWRDGFMIALSVPAGVLASLGFSIGSLGAWGAAALWGICCLLGLLQNFLFAEMAAMFPDKPGGIALYAHEAFGPTMGYARSTSGAPADAVISDSAMVAVLNFVMPCCNSSATTWGSLWVLTCGRSRCTSPACAIMRRRFSSMRSG